MERAPRSRRVPKTVAGLVLAAAMALGAAGVVSAVASGGPAHATAGIRWDGAPAGSVAMGVAPGDVHGPIADGIRWS